MMITAIAPRNAHFDPSQPDAEAANPPNVSLLVSAAICPEILLTRSFTGLSDTILFFAKAFPAVHGLYDVNLGVAVALSCS